MSEESPEIATIDDLLILFSNKIKQLKVQGLSAYVECTKELQERLSSLAANGEMDKFILINNNLYTLRGFHALCHLEDIDVGDTVCVLIEKTDGDWGWRQGNSREVVVGPFDSYEECIRDAFMMLRKGEEFEVGKVKYADPGKYILNHVNFEIDQIVDSLEYMALDEEFYWVEDTIFDYDPGKEKEMIYELRNVLSTWARRYFSSMYWDLDDIKTVKI